MIKARIRWCSCRVENILTLGKLLRLWFCFLLHSILFFISQTSYHTYKIISAMSSLVIIIGERSEPLSDKLGGEICIATRALVCIYICVRPDDRVRPDNRSTRYMLRAQRG